MTIAVDLGRKATKQPKPYAGNRLYHFIELGTSRTSVLLLEKHGSMLAKYEFLNFY